MAIFNAYVNLCHNSVMGIDPQPELLTSLKHTLDNNIRASILSPLCHPYNLLNHVFYNQQ